MNRIALIWKRFSKRERGLVIATLAIFVALLGRMFVLGPFLERREWAKSQLEIQPQRLEKNLRYIDRKSDIMAGLEKARAELKSLEPLLLTSDTASVSASDLQQTVQGLASRGGAQVISTRVLSPETLGPFTRIPIQLEISGLIEQVAGLIQGIESAPKLLVVNEINVRSFAIVGAAPRRPDGTATQPQQNLRVSLTVSGFVRNQPAAASSKEAISGAEGSAQDSGNRVERRPRLESDQ
ncbi:MAG TPA: type II secretion system protein GspM [Candidatus Binatia bacterium]|jgi:Tfp pilus assembly protein PilO